MAETPKQHLIPLLASIKPDGTDLRDYTNVAFLSDGGGTEWIFWEIEGVGGAGHLVTSFNRLPLQPAPRDPDASVYIANADGTVGEDGELEQNLDLEDITWNPAGFPQFTWQIVPNIP